MIIITVYGLDQFVVGRLSRELSANLADMFETTEDNFAFIASDAMVFHKGVEQTSWDTYINVKAPKKYAIIEDIVAHFLLEQFSYYSISVTVDFEYTDETHLHQKINKEYPRFITDENIVNVEDEYDDEEDVEAPGADDLYDGDIFQDFNKNNK